jgi:hypothetical protein
VGLIPTFLLPHFSGAIQQLHLLYGVIGNIGAFHGIYFFTNDIRMRTKENGIQNSFLYIFFGTKKTSQSEAFHE